MHLTDDSLKCGKYFCYTLYLWFFFILHLFLGSFKFYTFQNNSFHLIILVLFFQNNRYYILILGRYTDPYVCDHVYVYIIKILIMLIYVKL